MYDTRMNRLCPCGLGTLGMHYPRRCVRCVVSFEKLSLYRIFIGGSFLVFFHNTFFSDFEYTPYTKERERVGGTGLALYL
jgi:hypothetical protein